MGILTQVTLRVEPAFRLCETTEVIDFEDALASMQAIARSAEYVKLWWLPHTEGVIVFRYERTQEPGRASALARWFDTWIINRGVFALLLWIGRRLPGMIPPANRLVGRAYFKPTKTIGPSDRMLSTPMPTRHREAEYAVPLARASEALRGLRERSGVRVNFIQEVRFVKADDAWMSPASGRDTCQLGAYMAEAPGIDEYFASFEEMMTKLEGRPHWGKEFGAGHEDIRRMYPRRDEFVARMRELDPDGVLRNRFRARVLGAGE